MLASGLVVLAAGLAAAQQLPASEADQLKLAVALDDNTVAAYVEIVIDPQGAMNRCHVYKAWGKTRLAGQLCAVSAGSGWTPATGTDGKPTWGVVRRVLRFSPTDRMPQEARELAETPDLMIAVSRLPVPRNQVDLRVGLLVAADGRPQACQAEQAPSDLRGVAALACREAMKATINVPPALNSSFVTSYRVRITKGAAT